MIYSESQIASFILQYFLPFARLAAMFMVMPVVGARTVSPRVRLVLAFTTTILIVPILPDIPKLELMSLRTLYMVAHEVLVGLATGFIFQVMFQVFILAGQLMAMKIGLGFASMNDPTNGVQTTAISQFFLLLVTLMFVSIDGHVILIKLLVESFNTIPPGTWGVTAESLFHLVSLGTWMFSAAIVFALPVLTSLLVVNIAFGVMSRAAPQLNIFAVGFPFTLVMGLVIVYIGLRNFEEAFDDVMSYGFRFVDDFLLLSGAK